MNNLQPGMALPFFIRANKKDTTDFETVDYIAQCYSKLKDYDNSAKYYMKVIKALEAFSAPLGVTYLNLGKDLKSDNKFNESISSYASCYEVLKDPSILMLIANICDENLRDDQKALHYYKQYVASTGKNAFTSDYIEAVKKRIDYLEKKIAEDKAKKMYKTK